MKKALMTALFMAAIFAAFPAFAGIFDAPGGGAGGSDLADNWLNHVFRALPFVVEVPGIGAQNAPVGSTTTTMSGAMPGLFQRLCAMYSNAMLVLAVIILVYHLISLTVATAHDGRPMGKSAHQVWTPVRLVFALGLLVPIANGFSSGQWLVAWIAKQGSGLASYVWGGQGTGIGSQFMSQNPRSVVQPDTNPEAMIQTLIGIGVCAKAQQQALAGNINVYRTAPPIVAQNIYNALVLPPDATGNPLLHPGAAQIQQSGKALIISGAGVDGTPGSISKQYYAASAVDPFNGVPPNGDYDYWPDQKPCGSVTLPAMVSDPAAIANPVTAASTELQKAHVIAFQRIEAAALQVGASLQTAQWRGSDGITIPIYNGAGGFVDMPIGAGFGVKEAAEGLAQAYRDTYAVSVQNAANLTFCTDGSARGAGDACSGVPNNHVVYEPSVSALGGILTLNFNSGIGSNSDLGWMSAGGFFINMATRTNALGVGAASAPVVKGSADCTGQVGCGSESNTVAVQLAYEGEKSTVSDGYQECGGVSDFLSCITNGFRWVLSQVGLGNANGQWLWHTQFTSPHPLADIVTLGDKLVSGSIMLVGVGAAATVAAAGVKAATDRIGGTVSGWLTSTVSSVFWGGQVAKIINSLAAGGAILLGLVAMLFFALAAILFLPGVLLFYVLPLLPFFNFFTGIITWMVSLMQAVVAIPLIAIAHLSPHGEGLPSHSARGAYLMILQIFLRPVMMIFGLIVCVVVMNTGLALLNALFFGVYKFNMFGNAAGVLSNIIFFIIYAVAAFAVCNIAIQSIDYLPLKAVAWIGGTHVDENHSVDKFAAITALGHADRTAKSGIGAVSKISAGVGNRIGQVGSGLSTGAQTKTTGAIHGARSGNESNNPPVA